MKAFLILITASLALIACDDPISNEAPKCLETQKEEIEKHGCDNVNIAEYSFQGASVYVADPGNCIADGQAIVVDEDCNVLGYLGGIAGNMEINGENFNQNATFIQYVWEKN